VTLEAYISSLDRKRIKTSEEYLKEINDAPINLLVGTPGYMPPEFYVSVSERTRINNEKEPAVASTRTLHSRSDPPACNLGNINLDELISETYLKYMYNPDQLHSCRHLIRHKINSGETIDKSTVKHLKQIDNHLYKLYISKRKSYNPMALGVKQKSRKMNRKTRKMNRKTKYVKKY
jgi:hypothetical protein